MGSSYRGYSRWRPSCTWLALMTPGLTQGFGSVACGPALPSCYPPTIPDWHVKLGGPSRHLEHGKGGGCVSPARLSRNRVPGWEREQAGSLRKQREKGQGCSLFLHSILCRQRTWRRRKTRLGSAIRHKPLKAAALTPPHNIPQGFSCRPQPHVSTSISTSGADCEEAMDICFYVSHIHLHTFYIFIYKGLSKLFSAFFFLAKMLQLLSLVLLVCFILHSVWPCPGLSPSHHSVRYRDNLAGHSTNTRH